MLLGPVIQYRINARKICVSDHKKQSPQETKKCKHCCPGWKLQLENQYFISFHKSTVGSKLYVKRIYMQMSRKLIPYGFSYTDIL